MSVPPNSTPRWSRKEVAAVAALTVAGLGIHAWFALGADALDSDRALVILMARAFAEGSPSVYFWQQNYMGALEPLLLTPLALLGRATPVAAAFVGVAITAALAWLCVALARRLGGARWMTLLLWAVPPAVVVHHHVALYGARLVATLLVVAAFAWSLTARRSRTWVGVGLLVGVAWFGDHLMLPWALGVVWMATRRSGLRPLALGSVPVVAADTVAAILTPAVHLSGPNDPGSWLGNIPLLFGTTIPQLFGLLLSRGPTPLFETPAPVVPSGALVAPWLATALPGLAVLALLAVTLVRRRRELTDPASGDAATGLQALLLVVLSGLGLFAFVGGGGDVWPARYLVPLWPALSLLAGWAVARWPRHLRPLAAVIVLPALFTLAADSTWPRAGDAAAAREEAARVAQAVEASDVEAVWADYWDAYRLALLAGDTPPWFPLRIIERRPQRLEAALGAGPVGYLARPEDTPLQELLSAAPAAGDAPTTIIAGSTAKRGSYRLVVTPGPVPGVLQRNAPPPRGWQMLAALAAGLTFLGAGAGVVALAAFLGRVSRQRVASGTQGGSRRPS